MFTQQNIDDLRALIASGVKEIEYNGRRMTYQTANELLLSLNAASASVDAASTVKRRGLIRVEVGSGF